jgi:hypothetical protein
MELLAGAKRATACEFMPCLVSSPTNGVFIIRLLVAFAKGTAKFNAYIIQQIFKNFLLCLVIKKTFTKGRLRFPLVNA